MSQSRSIGPALPLRKALDRIHEMNVRPATFQQIGEFLPQRSVASPVPIFLVVFALGGLRGLLCLDLGFFQSYFSETSTVCGISGIGCCVVFEKPALPHIFSSSAN